MFEDLMFTMSLVIEAFFYLSIVILLVKQKDNVARLKLIVLISIVHLILFAPFLDPVLVDPLILVVLVIFGIPLWISKGTAIFILLIFMLLPVQQYFWLFIISKAVYVITLGGLIYSALFGEKSDEK